MRDRITRNDFGRMIAGGAALVRAQHAMLSQLDCAAGDGDHGATMLRVAERLETCFAAGSPEDLKACLSEAGWSVLGVDGGASSSLLGTFFSGMAESPARGPWISSSDLAAIFEAGLAAVRKQTKAQILRTSTSSFTAAADLCSAARSSSVSLISQIFSTPFAPSCAGTPT